jgi:nitrite reductase/ring-hydroxylating ferredoxin subunit
LSGNPARPPAGPGAKSFRFRAEAAMFAGVVVRVGEEIRGYVDSCPHAGWPLSALDDRYLTRDHRHILCAGHGALFRPLDGECVAGPCFGERLSPWPVEVREGRVVTA